MRGCEPGLAEGLAPCGLLFLRCGERPPREGLLFAINEYLRG